jgi:hypothetical protein
MRSSWLALALAAGMNAAPALSADKECLAWCRQADAECSATARESKRNCARLAATAGVDPITRRRDDTYVCGWFRGDNCSGRWAGANCADRQRARLDLCVNAYAPSTASDYLACNEGERKELALCRETQADCEAQCQ